jgi:very-short-patch-repair endonuclease
MKKPFSLFDGLLSKTEKKVLSHVGLHRFQHPRKSFTSLEEKYYDLLDKCGFFYIKQHTIEGRIFDAFLPDHGIIMEFDGVFWHPQNASECKYEHQKKALEVDKLKNDIAWRHGFKMIRIREDEDVSKAQLKKMILG